MSTLVRVSRFPAPLYSFNSTWSFFSKPHFIMGLTILATSSRGFHAIGVIITFDFDFDMLVRASPNSFKSFYFVCRHQVGLWKLFSNERLTAIAWLFPACVLIRRLFTFKGGILSSHWRNTILRDSLVRWWNTVALNQIFLKESKQNGYYRIRYAR